MYIGLGIIGGLLTWIGEQMIPFTLQVAEHSANVDDRLSRIEMMLNEHEKVDADEKTTFKSSVAANTKAIEFHNMQIETLEKCCQDNTDALYVMLKKH